MVQAVAFRRTDTNVIDWLRPEHHRPLADLQRARRGHDRRGAGSVAGRCRATGCVRAEFTGLDVSAPSVTQLSKYALDYAPRSFVATAVLPRFGRVRMAPRLEYRDRRRPRSQPDGTVAVSSQDYVLLDTRVSVRLSAAARS